MSRRALFRPRAIDLTRPLLIVRSDADLKSDVEIVSAQRALPEYGTGVEEGEMTERHLQEALLASMNLRLRRVEANEMQQQRAEDESNNDIDGKRTVMIPVPVIRETPEYADTLSRLAQDRFHEADSYIDFDADDRILLEREVDYEADDEDRAMAEHRLGISLDAFERAMDRLEKEQGTSRNLLSFDNMKNLLMRDTALELDVRQAKELYEYWKQKRDARKGEALLRYLRNPPDINNTDLSVAFRPRNEEEQKRRARSNTFDNYKRMRRIRQDMERVRTIMEQVMKRERIKLDHALFSSAYQLAMLLVRYPQSEPLIRAHRSLRLKTSGGVDLSRNLANLAELARKGILRWDAATGRRYEDRATSDHSGSSVTKIRVTMAAKSRESVHRELAEPSPKRDLSGFDEKGFYAFQRIGYFTNGFFRDGVNPYDWRVYEGSHIAFRNSLANLTERLRPLRAGADNESRPEINARDATSTIPARPKRALRNASVLIVRLTTPMAYSILDAARADTPFLARNSVVADYLGGAFSAQPRIATALENGSRPLMCFPDSVPFCDQKAALENGFRPTLVRARKGCDQEIYLDRITILGTGPQNMSENPPNIIRSLGTDDQRIPWPKRRKSETK
ncbi:hypothetical protein CCYA_CCYA17G4312 [Cyanidiococcus yangmingshanensis]|nr:hypothetical protein CCYA_CCYA17G4312 [Cyanidiococcus yangmingshanensis]